MCETPPLLDRVTGAFSFRPQFILGPVRNWRIAARALPAAGVPDDALHVQHDVQTRIG